MFWTKIFKRKDENKEVTEEKAAVQPDPKSSEPKKSRPSQSRQMVKKHRKTSSSA